MKNRPEIISVNIGKPTTIKYNNKEVETAINKRPFEEPIFLSSVNLAGDEQADLVHHGGKDKAVCVYSFEHYPYWEEVMKQTLSAGAFGENLTTRGLLEEDVCIGDIYEWGEAILQVSQPRQPCFKLSAKYGLPELPLKVQQTGFTGFYFRVLKEGIVHKEHPINKMNEHPKQISISYANYVMHQDKDNSEGMKRILEVEELSENWKATFRKRLQGLELDSTKRLNGDL